MSILLCSDVWSRKVQWKIENICLDDIEMVNIALLQSKSIFKLSKSISLKADFLKNVWK